ncbi:MAG: hypothetical protein DWQ05_07445 [Calditrichaeota bacterium]|nr:MAG: hypothetical protein DWQ05_07445 [Calditrichota bacterium]
MKFVRSLFRSNFQFKGLPIAGIIILLVLQGCAGGQQKKNSIQAVYVIGGGGFTQLPYKNKAEDDNIFVGKSDDGVATGHFLAGLTFHENAMVELGYSAFGTMNFDGKYTWMGVPTDDIGEIKTKGFTASVVGNMPFKTRYSLLGRLGLFRWSVDEDEIFGGIPESHSVSGTSPILGAGVQTAIIKQLGLRIEWQHLFNVGEQDETGEGDIDIFAANVYYTFPLQ